MSGPDGSRLVMAAESTSLPELLTFVSAGARRLGLDGEPLLRVEMAAEEVLTNVLKYAYAGGAGPVGVACRREGDRLAVEIADRGAAFNPLEAPEPDLSLGVSERTVGGLGIHLVRHFLDHVAYRREAGENVLTLFAALPAGS